MPSSHLAPINPPPVGLRAGADALSDAFTEFNLAAGRLEKSYQELQKEVVQLRAILAERSRALCSSRAENTHMKLELRQIVDSLPCGVIVLDIDRRVTLINREARNLLEVTGEQVGTLDDTPLAGQLSPEAFIATSANESDENEICVATPTGKRWLALRSRGFQKDARDSTSGQKQQTILILRDSTGHKKLEQEREQARNVVALAEMTAVLAHEIRNPLASLELFTNLIAEESGCTREYVSHLRAGIRNLSATVNNVLCLHGAASLRLARVGLADTLRDAVEFARPLADQKQVRLSLTESLGRLEVVGDPSALQQLVLNLALNAFRHTAAGGSLQITATRIECVSQLRARIEVGDTGCGISEELLPRLFEAGFSASGQTPGLGLAVCRRIVELHGGSISVSSRPGIGTSFVLELPAR